MSRVEPNLYPQTATVIDGWWLRKSTPEDLSGLGEDSAAEATIRRQMQRRLRCRNCKQPITSDDYRIAIAGRHLHRRVNPMGVEFEFGCFGEAPGAATLGEPTVEFSWFTGYAWSFAHCGRCDVHLGWLFEGGDPPFFGLIAILLEDEEVAEED